MLSHPFSPAVLPSVLTDHAAVRAWAHRAVLAQMSPTAPLQEPMMLGPDVDGWRRHRPPSF